MSSLLLLNSYVEEVAVGYTVGTFSLILIGLSLLIILYRILKWIIRVDENMSYLREVLQTYKQLQEEKEKVSNRIIKRILLHQTLRNLRQKIVMLKIKLQPYTMNIIFIHN